MQAVLEELGVLLYVFQIAGVIVFQHMFLQPLVGFFGAHLPSRGTGADNLDKVGAFAGHGIFEGFPDGLFPGVEYYLVKWFLYG